MSDAFVLVLMPASSVWQLLGGAGWPGLLPDPRPGSYDWTGLWWPARQGLDAEAKPFVPTAFQPEACGDDVSGIENPSRTRAKLGVSLETPEGLPFEEVLGGGSVPDLLALVTAVDQPTGSLFAHLRPGAEVLSSDGDGAALVGLVKGLDPPQGVQVDAGSSCRGGILLSSLGGREAATAQHGKHSTCLTSVLRELNDQDALAKREVLKVPSLFGVPEFFQSDVPLPADAAVHQSDNVETGRRASPAQTERWIDHRVAIDAPWHAVQPSGSALAEQDGVVVKEEVGGDEKQLGVSCMKTLPDDLEALEADDVGDDGGAELARQPAAVDIDDGGAVFSRDLEAPAVKAVLVKVIKAMQRAGQSTKMAWGAYCDESANGVRDPDRHDIESLVCFMNSRSEFRQFARELLP
jgi:hypothetical protein